MRKRWLLMLIVVLALGMSAGVGMYNLVGGGTGGLIADFFTSFVVSGALSIPVWWRVFE